MSSPVESLAMHRGAQGLRGEPVGKHLERCTEWNYNYCDILKKIVQEQNGFRQNRSCIYHIYSITTIVKNCICDYKHVFCAFIDLKKAFDSTNRNILFYRFLSYNIDSHKEFI